MPLFYVTSKAEIWGKALNGAKFRQVFVEVIRSYGVSKVIDLGQGTCCYFQPNLMKRKILVILSNRVSPLQKPRWVELDSDEKGNIYKQRRLRSQPRQARYDEVWENDEGRSEFASCFRFKRRYRHKLQKPARA